MRIRGAIAVIVIIIIIIIIIVAQKRSILSANVVYSIARISLKQTKKKKKKKKNRLFAARERSDGGKEKKFKKCPDLRCDDFQTKNIPDHDPVSRVLRRFRFSGGALNLADVCA